MPVVNHKVYLYKPDGTTFLGELIVDNLKADIKLQEISTVSFRIPEVINNQVNLRVDEVLDSYIIELWYGRVDGVYGNGDFEKIRFRIYSTPLEFADYQYLHSYAGYSIESDLEFKQITSWRGIEVKDFFRTITYNKNAATPRFTETGFTYTISTSSNTSGTKYITIGTTDEPTALDIFIYETRTNSANNSESEVSLIELASGGVNGNDFKAGYYYLNKTGDVVNSVSIALPDNYTTFNGVATANFSYKFYDNPVARAFAVGIKTNTAEPLSNMYIDLAQDAALGDDTPEYGGYTFSTQSIYSKNGLKLNDILTGVDNVQDGILYNTGFTVGTISNTIAAKYRSNIDFNNITSYQAIKDIAESFESIAVFNTVDKTVSFYAENEYGSNNGLVIKYATYLKSINKEIDAAKIITNARALGKDNIKISLVNPTGSEVWEDYSYFLDDYHIQDTTGFTITQNATTGLDITYPSTSGFQSRWMDTAEAIKVAKWQYTRDYFHTVFSSASATTVHASHNQYKNLYNLRSAAINLYVKYETQYFKKKADEYKYFYLLEHYRDLYENKGTNLTEYQYYQNKYNIAVTQAAAFKSTSLDAAYDNIYDTTSIGSLAYKFAQVQSFLDKDTWEIDLDKLRTFQREAVHNDSKVDNEQDLVEATKIYVDENKEPRVTFNISIIDVLEAQEAYQDWDKFVTGDKIYIYFPEFNIDLEAQIREISIDFQSKTLSVVISTVRNYNRSFGNYLTKNIRRFHNANMNTVLYYKDGTDASITQTEDVRTTLDTGINAGETSVNTGATDGSTGESSTTTDGEGQKSRVVTGVDLYTETLTLGAFTTGVKINDGRLLTFKPFDVSGIQWVQEVEVSAENGFVIRRVYGDNTVTKLAYIDATDGSAYFAGWELEPGQFSAGSTSSYVAINSQAPSSGNSLYAFWAGDETASSAPFSVTKAGAIKATAGTIAGLNVGTGYVSTADKSATTNPKNAIFKRGAGGAGVWGENETAFYLDEDGRFSLSNELTWNPSTNTFFVNGTIEATIGEIGGWTVAAEKLHAGSTTTYVELNADAASSYAIFAGSATAASAPFSVTKSGTLVASSATITGSITSTSGTIGGWSIGATTLSQNNLTLNSAGTIIVGDSAGDDVAVMSATDATYRLWIGDFTAADAPFSVDKDGQIKSTAGVIGGWSLNSTRLLKAYDAGLTNDVNIYAGAMPSAISTSGAGEYGFAVENTNPDEDYPFVVAMTNKGFYVFTDSDAVNSYANPVSAMEITYDEDYIWAKGLLISDNKNVASANVSIGTLAITDGAASNWGLVVNNGTAANGSSVTIDKDGIEIIKTVSSVSSTNFSVDTAGNVAIKGDLTASTGTFGTVATDKGNVLLGGSDPLIVRNNTTEILKLTNAGVLTIGNWSVDDTSISASEFVLQYDATNPYLSIKQSTNPGWYNPDADPASTKYGIFLGYDNNAAKMSLASATNYLVWDGSDLKLKGNLSGEISAINIDNVTIDANGIRAQIDGSSPALYSFYLNADDGTGGIAGWEIDSNNITSETNKVQLQKEGKILVGGSTVDGNGDVNNATLIIDGTATGSSPVLDHANFELRADGSAIFSGALSAASGSFGDTTINSSSTLTIGTYSSGVSGDIKISNTNGIVARDSSNTTTFSVNTSGNLTATSGTVGGFTLGSSTLTAGATTTTVGISTGATTSNVAFYAGDATATSAPFRVTNAGALTSTSGSIGGWTINSDGIFTGTFDESGYTTSGITISNEGSIHSPNFYLDSTGITTKAGNIGGFTIGATSLTAGATTTSVGVTTDAVAFYAGNATPGSAPFRVTNAGALTATNATITGAITATSGSFTGAITSTSGFIGNWTIGANSLTGGNATLASSGNLTLGTSNDVVRLSADDATYRIWAGNATAASAPFSVTKAGAIKATSGEVGPLFLNNITSSSTANFTSSDYTTSSSTGTINTTSDSGSVTTNRTYSFNTPPFNLSSISVTYTTSGTSSGYWTLTAYVRYGSNVIATYTRQSAAGTFTWTTTGINAVATNIYFELTKGGGTPLTFSLTNVTGVRFLESMSIEDFAVYPNGTVFSNRIQNKDLTLIDNNIETRDNLINLKVTPTLIGGGGVAIINNNDTTRDAIIIQPNTSYGSSSRRVTISTAVGNLSQSYMARLPVSNADSIFALFTPSTSATMSSNLLFKVGRYSSAVNSDQRVTITFSSAFPTGLTYGVIVTGVGSTSMGLSGATVGNNAESVTNTGFVYVNDGVNNAAANGFSWIAFAY
jgi:hypothetical protein